MRMSTPLSFQVTCLTLCLLTACAPVPSSPAKPTQATSADLASIGFPAKPAPTDVELGVGQGFDLTASGGNWRMPDRKMMVLAPPGKATASVATNVERLPDETDVATGSVFAISATPELPRSITLWMTVEDSIKQAVTEGKLELTEKRNGAWSPVNGPILVARGNEVVIQVGHAGTYALAPKSLPLLGSNPVDPRAEEDRRRAEWYASPFSYPGLVIDDPQVGKIRCYFAWVEDPIAGKGYLMTLPETFKGADGQVHACSWDDLTWSGKLLVGTLRYSTEKSGIYKEETRKYFLLGGDDGHITAYTIEGPPISVQ